MLRLFGTAGLLTVVSAVLAVITSALIFRLGTILLGGGVVALYWWMQRSAPRRSPIRTVRGLRKRVEIYRDERGVPHIFGETLPDLFRVQGYVTAQDQLWSMDLARRSASGRLAEILGADCLPLDVHVRTVGLHHAAEASLGAYSPEFLALLGAYAAGVNDRIAEGSLPVEFNLLRYRPEPWTPLDSLAILKHFGYITTSTWLRKLFQAQLVQEMGPEMAAELFDQPSDPATLESLAGLELPDLTRLLSVGARIFHEGVGGTGCAVAGVRTRSTQPMLWGDYALPLGSSLHWYEIHLVGPDGLDLRGASLPGVPCLFMGSNADLAWTLAAFPADVQDLYVERLHPQSPEQFASAAGWKPVGLRHEEIRVRGAGAPVVQSIMSTDHGPVIARGGETAIALRWAGLDPGADLESLFAINQARSWEAFRTAAEQIQHPLTFLVAGKDTIGLKCSGRVPARTGTGRPIPVPGWTGDFDWDKYLPGSCLPEIFNPPEGYLVGSTLSAGGAYRARRLAARLAGSEQISGEKLKEIQFDLHSQHARELLQLLLHAVQEGLRQGPQAESLTEIEKQALLMLSGWDGDESAGAASPALWHQWYSFMLESMFRPQMGLAQFDQFLACGGAMGTADRLIRHVAEGGGSLWLSREGERGLNRVALRAFRRAVALVTAKQGRTPEGWRWEREHGLIFDHPLVEYHPWLRSILSLGPFHTGGSAGTLFMQGYSPLQPFSVAVASRWRFVADLGLTEGSQSSCVPGQSENLVSPYRSDQIGPWLKGELGTWNRLHREIRQLPRISLHPDPLVIDR